MDVMSEEERQVVRRALEILGGPPAGSSSISLSDSSAPAPAGSSSISFSDSSPAPAGSSFTPAAARTRKFGGNTAAHSAAGVGGTGSRRAIGTGSGAPGPRSECMMKCSKLKGVNLVLHACRVR